MFAGAVVWLTVQKKAPKPQAPAAPESSRVESSAPSSEKPARSAEAELLARPTPPEKLKAPPKPEPKVKDLGQGRYRVGAVTFDEKARTIVIPASVRMREGAVEYILVSKHGKAHEAVFVTDADARDVHLAALLLGMKPEPDLGPAGSAAKIGDHGAVEAWVEWDRNGPPARVPLNETVALADPESGQTTGTLPAGLWLYNGSEVAANGVFVASASGSIISIIRDPEALVNNPGATRDNDEIHTPNPKKLPKLQHPVRIVLKVR
jgi:hypothetical protein